MSEQPELRPCPFCGGAARLYDYDTEADTWPIECDNADCGARVQSKDSAAAAIDTWNRRCDSPNTDPELDWGKAKAHLDYMQKAYEDIGPTGVFALSITIIPLQDRYRRGERTKWLYDDICEVE